MANFKDEFKLNDKIFKVDYLECFYQSLNSLINLYLLLI